MSNLFIPGGTNIFGQETAPMGKDELLEMLLPMAGTMKTGKGLLTLWRGMPNWFKKNMVSKGKFVGGGNKYQPKDWLFTTPNKDLATHYAKGLAGPKPNPYLLEFQVPKKMIPKGVDLTSSNAEVLFPKGLSKKYLKKAHKLLKE